MHTITYRINWDALLARIIYRWHWKIALALLPALAAIGLALGVLPPAWRGTAALSVSAPRGALVELDRRPWPRTLYAGAHTVSATLPDGRRSWADITLRAGDVLTITLPAGLAEPLVRSLPAAAPDARVQIVEWAGGAWRATSAADTPPAPAGDARATDATPTPAPSHTVAFGAQGTERLSTIDAYAGLADQLQASGRALEAVYRPSQRTLGGDPAGAIEIRGWPNTPASVPVSAELTLLRFAPDGSALLVAERTPAGGEQVSVIMPGLPPAPIVAVPGRVRRISWSDDGQAAVLHSQAGERLSLTLVRLRPTLAAATVAELDATSAAALVPLTWTRDNLLWVAPDADGPALWSAPIATLIPQRRAALELRAIGARADGALDALWVADRRLVVGEYRDGALVGRALVPGIPPDDDLAGIWHGDELLIQSRQGAWLVTVHDRQPH